MGSYSKQDAAADTGVSTKEASQAWHQARNDAASSGELTERNINKTSDSESGSALGRIFGAIFKPSKDRYDW